MQLLFMYCVGYIIRLYDTSKNLKIRDLISGGVISYIIIATIAPHAWRLFYYNNPILIIFSLCIFLSFLKIQFTNRLINNFAKSMLAVYLLQEGLLGRRIYDIIYNIQSSTNTSKTIAIIGAYFIGLFTFAVLLEWIRFHLFNHLNNSLGNFLEKRLNISQ